MNVLKELCSVQEEPETRSDLIQLEAHNIMSELVSQLDSLNEDILSQTEYTGSEEKVRKRVVLCEKLVKVFYQETYKVLMEYQYPEKKKEQNVENLSLADTGAHTSSRKNSTELSAQEAAPTELTIKEHLSFT